MTHDDKIWALDFRREITTDLRATDPNCGRRRSRRLANRIIRNAEGSANQSSGSWLDRSILARSSNHTRGIVTSTLGTGPLLLQTSASVGRTVGQPPGYLPPNRPACENGEDVTLSSGVSR